MSGGTPCPSSRWLADSFRGLKSREASSLWIGRIDSGVSNKSDVDVLFTKLRQTTHSAGHHTRSWLGSVSSATGSWMTRHVSRIAGSICELASRNRELRSRMTLSFVDFNGIVPEKFDAVELSHMVDAE